MGSFSSSKFVSAPLGNIDNVINDVKNHMTAKGYEVTAEKNSTGAFISLSKGGMFKSILGMKTSLNVEIKDVPGGVLLDAKVGVFGQQAIPTLITWYLAWPVLLTQIAGLVQQSKLDDEVLNVIEQSIYIHQSIGQVQSAVSAAEFCTECGAKVPANAKFCPSCGASQ